MADVDMQPQDFLYVRPPSFIPQKRIPSAPASCPTRTNFESEFDDRSPGSDKPPLTPEDVQIPMKRLHHGTYSEVFLSMFEKFQDTVLSIFEEQKMHHSHGQIPAMERAANQREASSGTAAHQRKPDLIDIGESSLRADSHSETHALSVRSKAAEFEPLKVLEENDRSVVDWKVDARRLASKDTQAISGRFDLPLGGRKAAFTMMLKPKALSTEQGANSFRNCSEGVVSLKCHDHSLDHGASLTFSISLSGCYKGNLRGPVTYDFGQGSSLICGLPAEQETWTLRDAIDADVGILSVRLEVAVLAKDQ